MFAFHIEGIGDSYLNKQVWQHLATIFEGLLMYITIYNEFSTIVSQGRLVRSMMNCVDSNFYHLSQIITKLILESMACLFLQV